MGRRPTKAADNPFCRARLEAAKFNERLFSKEGAAELLGVSVSTLSDYELGLTKIVPPDMVVKMSDLYSAPELRNFYCTEMCPLGCEMPKVSVEDLDRITLRALSSLKNVGKVKDKLLDITEDGIISEDEEADMKEILESLEELEQISQSFRIWAKKNMQREEVEQV